MIWRATHPADGLGVTLIHTRALWSSPTTLAALDRATSNPSFSSSPLIRGAPKAGSRCSFAGSAPAGPPRFEVALPVAATCNTNKDESRPGAGGQASRAI